MIKMQTLFFFFIGSVLWACDWSNLTVVIHYWY
jgi:hypothetical protein